MIVYVNSSSCDTLISSGASQIVAIYITNVNVIANRNCSWPLLFKKIAFDTVWREGLWDKVSIRGVSGKRFTF